jgi:hypothetical protein
MAYDEKLTERIRAALKDAPGMEEKKMFGGVGFMLRGNMACGVHKDRLVLRVDRQEHDEIMRMPHTSPFDITGKAMKGWLLVEPEGLESEKHFQEWVSMGVDYSLTLPPK